MNFLHLFILTISLIIIAFLGMAIRVIFKKEGKFKSWSIGKNKKMKELGIICAKSEEIKCRRDIDKSQICESCSDF